MASSLHDCATAVAREPKVGSSIYRCDLGRLDASLIHRIFETLEQVVDFYNGAESRHRDRKPSDAPHQFATPDRCRRDQKSEIGGQGFDPETRLTWMRRLFTGRPLTAMGCPMTDPPF